MGQCSVKSSIIIENSSTKITKPATEISTVDSTINTKIMGNPIITPEELKKLIDETPANLRILDATIGNQDGYNSAHIPGAVYMDIFHKVAHTNYLVRNLPMPDIFQTYVRSLGISADSDVIIYDKADTGGGFMSSGRAWFLFNYFGHEKVRILDGGLAKWKESSYPLTSEVPSPEDGDFTANVREDLVKNFEEMVENLDSKTYQVVDTRPPATFAQGHIPGAKSIPFGAKLVDPIKKCLKSTDELKTAFEEAGVDISKPIVGSCMGGMTSCTALVAALLLGKKDVPLYVGSWTEWNQRAAENQIEKS